MSEPIDLGLLGSIVELDGAAKRGRGRPPGPDALGPAVEIADPLYNVKPPKLELKHEKAAHRLMTDLAMEGLTAVEIAEQTGFHPATVRNVIRQYWAQKRLTEGLNSARQQVVASMQEEVYNSWQKLLELRDSCDKPEVIAKVCESHLDRVFGKATQPLAVYDGVDLDKLSDEELAKLLPKTEATATNPPPKAESTNASPAEP